MQKWKSFRLFSLETDDKKNASKAQSFKVIKNCEFYYFYLLV